MPKLPKNIQKEAADANDDGDFKLLPDGRYKGTLTQVEVKPGEETPSGFDSWNCEFSKIQDPSGKVYPGRLWDNVSLSPKSRWKVKQFYNAMGYSLDSDTDEMIGDECVLVVGHEIAKQGKNAGKLRNVVNRLAPLDDDGWEDATKAADDDTEF